MDSASGGRGGAAEPGACLLVTDPIDPGALVESVRTDRSGAVVVFTGTVRNHHKGLKVESLSYQAYGSMAEQEMNRIATEAAGRWGLEGIRIVHRLGHLQVGEISVAVAVAAAHRKEAMGACGWAIDRVKERVPIWKKEQGEGGTEWVVGDDSPGSAGSGLDPSE